MLLTEFFNSPEGDSSAKFTSASPTTEAKRKITTKNDPCWAGHHMVGTKTKDGREVPNCVPGAKTVAEDNNMSDVIQAREYITQALRDPNTKHKYFDFLKMLRNKHGADYSTQVHQQAAKLAQGSN